LSTGPLILHATTVSVAGRGLLILGPSGAGKSALALELISRGAVLVADDRTQVVAEGGTLTASVPTAIAGLIEARGVGLLRTPEAGPTPVHLAVDLGQEEQQRLPEPHSVQLAGIPLPCLYRPKGPHFAAAILLYLRDHLTSAP